MNAGEFLIAAVYEVAFTAIFAIAAEASEEANAHALPYLPALHIGAEHVDLADDFVAGNTGPIDRKHAFNRARIGVADTASLDTYPHLAWAGISKRLPCKLKTARADGLHRLSTRFPSFSSSDPICVWQDTGRAPNYWQPCTAPKPSMKVLT